MENKLIPLSDFIEYVKLNNYKLYEKKYAEIGYNFGYVPIIESFTLELIYNYTAFIRQQNQLGMFVPCDENNVPLEEPETYDAYLLDACRCEKCIEKTLKCDEYKKAKERVLFEGFVLNGSELFNKELNISIYLDTYEYVEHHDNGYGGGNLSGIDIEALANAHLKLTLTATAIKSIYGS